MEAIFATIESFLGNLVDPATLAIVKDVLNFIVDFIKTFALIG